MIDIHPITSTSNSVAQGTMDSLRQLVDRTLASQQFVEMAEGLYWALLEGEYRSDDSPQTNQLRETLADITTPWESLLGNLHEQPEKPLNWR